MKVPTVGDPPLPSTRPYLIRALHAWCSDNGFTPHLAVQVESDVRVPLEYVKDGQIILNVALDATHGLDLGNDAISFKARFGGVARDIRVPVDRVVAIYARENGQGMSFPALAFEESTATPAVSEASPPATAVPTLRSVPSEASSSGPEVRPPDEPGPRPTLKRIK